MRSSARNCRKSLIEHPSPEDGREQFRIELSSDHRSRLLQRPVFLREAVNPGAQQVWTLAATAAADATASDSSSPPGCAVSPVFVRKLTILRRREDRLPLIRYLPRNGIRQTVDAKPTVLLPLRFPAMPLPCAAHRRSWLTLRCLVRPRPASYPASYQAPVEARQCFWLCIS